MYAFNHFLQSNKSLIKDRQRHTELAGSDPLGEPGPQAWGALIKPVLVPLYVCLPPRDSDRMGRGWALHLDLYKFPGQRQFKVVAKEEPELTSSRGHDKYAATHGSISPEKNLRTS